MADPPQNDSIDELLGGLPSDPMLPKRRARSMEEVRAATPPISQNRRADDKVVVSDGDDPREIARRDADRQRRESSTFGTAFLQASATREKVVFGAIIMLAVLGLYAFVRHTMRADKSSAAATAPSATVEVTHVLSAPASALAPQAAATPTTTAPTAETSATAPQTTATPTPTHVRSAHGTDSHASDAHSSRPAPPPSASNARTDVSRSL